VNDGAACFVSISVTRHEEGSDQYIELYLHLFVKGTPLGTRVQRDIQI